MGELSDSTSRRESDSDAKTQYARVKNGPIKRAQEIVRNDVNLGTLDINVMDESLGKLNQSR